MGDWTLYDNTDPVRSGVTEAEAQLLVDANLAEGNTDVYALGPGGARYPEL